MISFLQALKLIQEANFNFKLKTTFIQTSYALNHVCARDIVSKVNAPCFDNSAMDGYAVNLSKINKLPKKKFFYICETINAGDKIDINAGYNLSKYAYLDSDIYHPSVKIMTGAAIPKQFDTVIKKEDCYLTKSHQNFEKITVIKIPAIGSNIRRTGEDFKKNEILIKANSFLGADQIMVLAAAGISKVEVYKKTSTALINTGSEIEPDFTQNLKGGKIRNINGPYLMAKLNSQNVMIDDYSIISDNKSKFVAKIKSLLAKKIELIISTGAVSAGELDFIPDALLALNAKIIFHKVAIRPGYPVIFAHIPNLRSKNGCYFFGLPGNPVTAAVCYKFFVCQFLSKFHDITRSQKNFAKLKNQTTGKIGYTSFKKCFCSLDKTGQLWAKILQDQSSASTKNAIKSNCWAKLLPNKVDYNKNDVVEIHYK